MQLTKEFTRTLRAVDNEARAYIHMYTEHEPFIGHVRERFTRNCTSESCSIYNGGSGRLATSEQPRREGRNYCRLLLQVISSTKALILLKLAHTMYVFNTAFCSNKAFKVQPKDGDKELVDKYKLAKRCKLLEAVTLGEMECLCVAVHTSSLPRQRTTSPTDKCAHIQARESTIGA